MYLKIRRALLLLWAVLMLLPISAAAAPAPASSAAEVKAVAYDGFWKTVSAAGKTYWTASYGRSASGVSSGTLRTHAINRDYLYGMTSNPCTYTGSHLYQNGCDSNYIHAGGQIAQDGDSQCSGFAAYMAYVVFGQKAETDYRMIAKSAVRSYLKDTGLKPGDIVRYKLNGGGGHSTFVYATGSSGFETLECNSDGKCGVYRKSRSFDYTAGKTDTRGINSPIYVDSILYILSGPLFSQVNYIDSCTACDSQTYLTAKQNTAVMSLPCTPAVNSESEQSGTLTAGQAITGTKLYKNTKGEYWYKVSGGYVYAGDTSAELNWGSVTVTDVTGPKGSRSCGASLSLKGTVSSSLLPLQKVGAYVYPGSAILPASGQKAETGSEVSISKKSYSIAGTDVDNKCKIGSLYAGPHTYIIKAKLTNNYSPDGKTLVSESKWFWVHTQAFTVNHSWNSSGVCSGCGSKKSCSHSWSSAVTLLPALKTAGEETATCSICKTIRVTKLPSVWDSCKHLELPAQLSVLDAAAFSDTAAELIVIPADTVEIGAQAFAGCSALKALVFEGEPERIAEDALSAGSSITVYCRKGGTVEAWAKQLGLMVSEP